jgi:hypothetical protein
MTDHGLIIPLTSEPHEPERHIQVYADHAAHLEEVTLEQAVAWRLGLIQEMSRDGSMEILKRSSVRMAGQKAERAVVRFYHEKLGMWLVEDFVEIVRNGIEFSLELRTKPMNYERDVRIFEPFLESFAFRKRG